MPTRASADPVSTEEIAAVRALARLARFTERTLGGFSPAHYRILTAIDEGDVRASRIAAKLALGKPTVSTVIDQLARQGLLTKQVADSDQRASMLALTEQGKRVLAAAESALVAGLRELVSGVLDGTELVPALATFGVALEADAVRRAEHTAKRRTP